MTAYLAVISLNFQRFLAYPLELVATVVRRGIEIGLFILFWVVIAKSSGGSLSTNGLAGYFLISSSVAALTSVIQMKLAQRINSVIRNGSLSTYLVRPLHSAGFLLAESIGSNGPAYVVAIATLCLGLLLVPTPTPAQLLLFFASLAVAFILASSINLLVGSISLYIGESSSYRHCVIHIIRILSGAMVPLAFFPETIRRIVELTPFPATVSGPTVILTKPDLATQLPQLGIAAAWCLALTWIALVHWNRSLHAYDAVGI